MKTKGCSHFIRSTLGLTGLLLFGACAVQVPQKDNEQPAEIRDNLTDIRLCSSRLTVQSERALEGFFEKLVRNLEGYPTVCLDLDYSGSELTGVLRIEYEDDFGIRFYNAAKKDVFYGEIDFGDDENEETVIDLVFIDEVGFVQVWGMVSNGTILNTLVRYYNFPSQEGAIDDAVAEARARCQEAAARAQLGLPPIPGNTVANCLGFNYPPSFWWDEPFVSVSERQRMIDEARKLLKSSKARNLGTVDFDLTEVLKQ